VECIVNAKTKRLKALFVRQEGIAMATVVMMVAVLTLLGVVLIDQVTAEQSRASAATVSDNIFSVAEAGINDYVAKLTEDPQYYDHCVAKAESTRVRSDNGASVGHSVTTSDCDPATGSSAWPGSAGVTWTYPSKDWWYPGTGSGTGFSGYAYNLMIAPPSEALGTNYVTVVSTACKVLDPDATPLQCDPDVSQRAIEVHLKYTTPADFQYMTPDMHDYSVCWASTIYGKLYSPGDIKVCGTTTYGDLMAENRVTDSGGWVTLMGDARIYDRTHPDIRDVVKDPINMPSDISGSISDVKRAAELNTPSTSFDDTSADAWRVVFSADKTVKVWKCVQVGSLGVSGSEVATYEPVCPSRKLTANVTLRSTTGTTVYVSSNASLPSSGTVFIGPASLDGTIDAVTYTGKTSPPDDPALLGARCAACGSGGRSHVTGEFVFLPSSALYLTSSVTLQRWSSTSTVTVHVNSTTGLPDTGMVLIGPRTADGRIDVVTYDDKTNNTLTGARCFSCSSSSTHNSNELVTAPPEGDPVYNGPFPSNGALYTAQDTIFSWPAAIPGYTSDGSSTVDGRITVATSGNAIIAGPIHYDSENAGNPDDDVLGIVADRDFWLARYAPNQLWFRASTMAQGLWGDHRCSYSEGYRGNDSSLTFVGTAAYDNGTGCIQRGTVGGYNINNVRRISDDGSAPGYSQYDALKFLFPPWSPVLYDGRVDTALFREVPSGYSLLPAS
jgi:Tfp pilus assembly protein PilX